MNMTIKLLSRFENDLEFGWDYAIDKLNRSLPYCFNGGYNYIICRIIAIYYESYNLEGVDITDYDGGLVYEIRSNQINLLLKILKYLRELKLKQQRELWDDWEKM